MGVHVAHCRRAAALVLLFAPLVCGELTGKVTRIVDGDTLDVLIERSPMRIRLNGIDCPEKGQMHGSAADRATGDLAFGKVVKVIVQDRDRNGRVVGDILLPDGRNLGHELVRLGYAWWFRRYAPKDETLRRLEEEARDARRGLWADPDPIPPWEWRRLPAPR